MPRRIRPMLCELVDAPFDRAGWLFEVKWDGYRAIAHVRGGRVTLTSRKRLLRTILPRNERILYSTHALRHGKRFFALMRRKHLEGMVAKDSTSIYEEGRRTGAWQKMKTHEEQEAVIIGFTKPRGTRKHIGSLVLAAYDKGMLRYVGHSGGGFTGRDLATVHAKLAKITTEKAPVKEKMSAGEPVTWVHPRYVCEIRFTEWTADGRMRHPTFTGLRTDKRPREVTLERSR